MVPVNGWDRPVIFPMYAALAPPLEIRLPAFSDTLCTAAPSM